MGALDLLIGAAIACYFFAFLWHDAFRNRGGWNEVRSSRSAPPGDPRSDVWRNMDPYFRMLYFALPTTIVVGSLAAVAAALWTIFLK